MIFHIVTFNSDETAILQIISLCILKKIIKNHEMLIKEKKKKATAECKKNWSGKKRKVEETLCFSCVLQQVHKVFSCITEKHNAYPENDLVRYVVITIL